MDDLKTSIQVLQCEYDDLLSTPRQKNPVSRTVGPRPGPRTHCPPLKNFMMWTYSPFTDFIIWQEEGRNHRTGSKR
ncbi:hypothetical protein J6590_088768 [Homalodisca vitripennis]|nr:hypothetical protein J6590_088768 [Homalodisca vitripennis]